MLECHKRIHNMCYCAPTVQCSCVTYEPDSNAIHTHRLFLTSLPPIGMLPQGTAKETDTMKMQWFGCLWMFCIPWRRKDYLLVVITKFNPLDYIAYDHVLLYSSESYHSIDIILQTYFFNALTLILYRVNFPHCNTVTSFCIANRVWLFSHWTT